MEVFVAWYPNSRLKVEALEQAAAAWQAAAAAGGYGEEGQGQHQQARGATAYRSVQGADWGGGYGPARRRPLRSLRRFLGRQY